MVEYLGYLAEGERTNSLRNSTMAGAVSGTPGTLPNNWNKVDGGGLTQTITAGLVINGRDSIDIQFSGVPTVPLSVFIGFETTTGVDALTGEDWTLSSRLALISGDLSNINSINLRQIERDVGGVFILDNQSADIKASLSLELQQLDYFVTLSGGGSVAKNQPGLIINFNASDPVDFTLRIATPQLEKGAFSSSFIPSSTVTETRTSDKAQVNLLGEPWFNPIEGTIVAQFQTPQFLAGRNRVVFLGTDNNDQNGIWVWSDSTFIEGVVVSNGILQAVLTTPLTWDANTPYKIAFGFKENDFALACNGEIVTVASGILPINTDRFMIGSAGDGNDNLFGTIKSVELKNTRLSNEELIVLSTIPIVENFGLLFNNELNGGFIAVL